jgi:polyisoprenoid-binding protein YceI
MRLPNSLCALLASAAIGATVQAAALDYQLEKTHVDVLFAVNHLGFSWKHGSFRGVSGSLSYDAQHPQASRVAITIEADTIDTGHVARDTDLKGEQFLDAQKFPEIKFHSTKIQRDVGGGFTVWGDLSLHGVTRQVELQVKINGAGQNPFDHKATIGFSAIGHLNRSDFGVRGFLPAIGDLVRFEIDVEFSREAKASASRLEEK